MADPHWTSYVGMVTGIIGTITGVSGAIMGYVSYRRSNANKALDMRLTLRKIDVEIEAGLSSLDGLLEQADKSRKAVASATGNLGSGAMVIWERELEQSKRTLEELERKAPPATSMYEDFDLGQLESKLVAAHKLQGEVTQLADKYKGALAADDEIRKQLRGATHLGR